MEENYQEVNKKTFKLLAKEYQEKWMGKSSHQKDVLEPFSRILKNKFNEPIVLDVGCAVGSDTKIMNDLGVKTDGMDYCCEMVDFAKKNFPKYDFLCGDFFDFEPSKKYNGLLMGAFIHLFPKKDVAKIMEKAKRILVPGGMIFIGTTKHDKPFEGYLSKDDYKNKLKRFRKQWTKEELEEEIKKNGFNIIEYGENSEEVTGKHWMTFIVEKID